MRQSEPQTDPNNNDYFSKRKNNHQFHRIGQLRRAKLHAAHLMNPLITTKYCHHLCIAYWKQAWCWKRQIQKFLLAF